MKRQALPAPELADHDVTMAMLRERAGDDPDALAEVEEWGQRRVRRLEVLRGFAALRRSGVMSGELDRVDRDFVVEQCFAIATRHGLDIMDYEYNDSDTGPISSLMGVDLHAVRLDCTGDTDGLFPDASSESAFLEEVRDAGHDRLARMARDAVIPDRTRLVA